MTKPFFEIYTRSFPPCRYCRDLKELLNIYGYDFYEKDITDPDIMEEFKTIGYKQVPQVYLDGLEDRHHIGGYETTKTYLRRVFFKDHPNRDTIITELEELNA